MQSRSSKILSAILLSFLLSSCGTVKLKDGQACGDMGRLGATCDNVFTDKPVDYDEKTWEQKRVGRISLTPALFANWKAALIKFCNDTKRCTFEEEQAVEEVGKRVDRLIHKMRLNLQEASSDTE